MMQKPEDVGYIGRALRIHLCAAVAKTKWWGGSIPLRRAWQTTPVFLPEESPWTEEPGRLQSMGFQESDTTEQLNHHYHQALFYTLGLKGK